MKSSLILFFIFTISIITLPTMAQDLTADEEIEEKTISLLRTIDLFNLYFKKADANQLDPLLADRYMHTNGSSAPYTKKVWLNYIRSRKTKLDTKALVITEYGMTDITLTFYDQVALVNGVVFSKGEENEVPFDKKFRVTHLWVMENDQWKRAGFHDGNIE
ncbi:MAG: nuclear transport factor 2 family protein [Cytophagales bacterium]|nr:nuclear transport factor 2 family protein [Cytophagales bacterium]